MAPVDVISAESLQTQGTTELAQACRSLAPSIDFPAPVDHRRHRHVRPATLRGLAPDQTLVLVNNTRRHASALVNVNGSIGRGSAAVDLNAIPPPPSTASRCCATAPRPSTVPTPSPA